MATLPTPSEARCLTSKQISIADSQVEGAVVQIIRSWATAFPDELVAFERQVRFLRSGLYRSNAVSLGRSKLHKAEIPAKVHAAMCRFFGRDWVYDNKLLNMFLRNFRVGLVNRTSVVVADKRR